MAKEVLEPTICATCGTEREWRQCYNCEDGFDDHDCGEDTCCCLNPQLNTRCNICEGKGGWLQCWQCAPWEE
jgi:hypothetical protein